MTVVANLEKARNDRFADGPRLALLVGMWAAGSRDPSDLWEAAGVAEMLGHPSDASDLRWLAEYQSGGSPTWEKDL